MLKIDKHLINPDYIMYVTADSSTLAVRTVIAMADGAQFCFDMSVSKVQTILEEYHKQHSKSSGAKLGNKTAGKVRKKKEEAIGPHLNLSLGL